MTLKSPHREDEGRGKVMGYKLLMAEKPSVARDLARVLVGEGNVVKKNGYVEGNGLLVTWAVGHLVGLAEPEEYGFVSMKDMYGDKAGRAYDELPLIPQGLEFKLVVLEATKDQFKVIKELIHRDDVEEVINCGDMGPEGHVLQWLIREKAGCRKPVRRFCATSMTDEAIRDAWAHLREEREFEDVVKGELCKKKADWILGMSLSRAESLKYHANISVGRVQSPTLYFVVQRYLEVQGFKKETYYGIVLCLAGNQPFEVHWNKDAEGAFPPQAKDPEGRVKDLALVEGMVGRIQEAGVATVEDVTVKKRATDRPQLYDITELQRDANRKYGYTAALTLAAAQALYETQKVLSYPRTDSRYVTSDLVPYLSERVRAVGGIPGYQEACTQLLNEGLLIDKRIVDDGKVTDHHAIIPTEKVLGFDVEAMEPTAEERKDGVTERVLKDVLGLVLCRLIVALSKPYVYEQTQVVIKAQDLSFNATGIRPLSMGWKSVQEGLSGREGPEGEGQEGEGQEGELQAFPELVKGQELAISRCGVVKKETTPPKLHTEATLLTAMENAGATIEGGKVLKGKGIGTQATRAGIIQVLFQRGYVKNKDGSRYVIPTSTGIGVIHVLPPELYSPKVTADWETMIAEIVGGKKTERDFFDRFIPFIQEKVQAIKSTETGVKFSSGKEVISACPFCGGDVYAYGDKAKKETRYYCGAAGRKEGCCRFSISDKGLGALSKRRLTEGQVKDLLAQGFIRTKVYLKDGTGVTKKVSIRKKEVDGKAYAVLEVDWKS